MEPLDLQRHKTTIYITGGFTLGFMALLTCLWREEGKRTVAQRHGHTGETKKGDKLDLCADERQ